MGVTLIYLKSHRRRPVLLREILGNTDRQGTIPAGWCASCGREVFFQNRNLCPGCRRRKGERRWQ